MIPITADQEQRERQEPGADIFQRSASSDLFWPSGSLCKGLANLKVEPPTQTEVFETPG